MKRTFWLISALCALCLFLLAGCFGLFDSGIEWRGGPYVLTWIDDPDNVTLNYDAGKGSMPGRIEARVFAVGWNGRYLVAKQHPSGDKTIANFFIIDSQQDGPYADPRKVILGPLNESEFMKKAQELNLPPFSKKLESLE